MWEGTGLRCQRLRIHSQHLRKAVCVEGGNGRTIQNGARRLRRIPKGEQNLGPKESSREKMRSCF